MEKFKEGQICFTTGIVDIFCNSPQEKCYFLQKSVSS